MSQQYPADRSPTNEGFDPIRHLVELSAHRAREGKLAAAIEAMGYIPSNDGATSGAELDLDGVRFRLLEPPQEDFYFRRFVAETDAGLFLLGREGQDNKFLRIYSAFLPATAAGAGTLLFDAQVDPMTSGQPSLLDGVDRLSRSEIADLVTANFNAAAEAIKDHLAGCLRDTPIPDLAAVWRECLKDFREPDGDFDPARDLMAGDVALRYVVCWDQDKDDSSKHYLGRGASAVYWLKVKAARNGDISVTAQAMTSGGREQLYSVRFSETAEGRQMLEAFERVPAAVPLLREELEQLDYAHIEAAAEAIASHNRGELTGAAETPSFIFGPVITSILGHPASPSLQIFKGAYRPRWLMWGAKALGGSFYTFSQQWSCYLFYVSDDGIAVCMEEVPTELTPLIHSLYYHPVDASEGAAAYAKLESADVPEGAVKAATARMLELAAR
jgi:hypothetical protein